MLTFSQFLENRKKANGLFGMGTGHSPSKLMAKGASKPAKPTGPKYVGLSVAQVYPVGKMGRL